MAVDVKISGLPAATTPLAGTEVLPIVQSATTKKVSIDNLTAGKSVSATSFVPTGATVPTNGMFLGAANSVSIATNSVEHWMFNASGNFNPVGSKGIGTSAAPVNGIVADAYQFSSANIITDATAARTLSSVDNGKVIYCTNAGGITITTASGLGVGFSCAIIQGAAGNVTIAQGGGTTLGSYSGQYVIQGQYGTVRLFCPVADTFVANGDLGSTLLAE